MSRENIGVLPHSIESEQSLLGAMICDVEIIDAVREIVNGSDFYAPIHDPIFTALLHLRDDNAQIDKIALAETLRSKSLLDRIGGMSYLSLLMGAVQTTASAKYHAEIVREKALLRKLYSAGDAIQRLALNGESDVDAALVSAEMQVRSILDSSLSASSGPRSSNDIGGELSVEFSRNWGRKDTAVRYPWHRVEKMMNGMHPGELIVLAAAPGAGKSAAAMQIGLGVATQGHNVLVCALEMGTRDTALRVIASRTKLKMQDLRNASFPARSMADVDSSLSMLRSLPISFLDRTPRRKAHDITRILRQASRSENPPRLVIIDHAGFLAESVRGGSDRASRHERLDEVYQELLFAASEAKVTMIVVQHLSRAGANSDKPSLSHLRDGGNLEGHAHAVIFPHRPDAVSRPREGAFIIAKNRDGATGEVEMIFEGSSYEWREASNDAFAGVA